MAQLSPDMTSSTPQDIANSLNTSQASSSTTGMSSYQFVEDGASIGFEERGENDSFDRSVDQGLGHSTKRPRALYTARGPEAPAGYEPKTSSTEVVGERRVMPRRRNTSETDNNEEHFDISGESTAGQRWTNELAEMNEKIERILLKTERDFLLFDKIKVKHWILFGKNLRTGIRGWRISNQVEYHPLQ